QVCPLTAASHAPRSDFGARVFGTGWGSGTASAAGYLTRNCGAADTNANGEAFGILQLSCLGLTRGVRVQEETSAPHARLAYIHLHSSFKKYRKQKIRVAA